MLSPLCSLLATNIPDGSCRNCQAGQLTHIDQESSRKKSVLPSRRTRSEWFNNRTFFCQYLHYSNKTPTGKPFYNFIRCYHWGNYVKGTQDLSTFFLRTAGESTISIQNFNILFLAQCCLQINVFYISVFIFQQILKF